MSKFLLNVALLFLVLSPFFVHAQTVPEEKISGLFSGLSFERFAQMVEAKSSYHFYFKSTEVDSLIINVNASQNTIEQILDRVFSETDLNYTIDHENRIFISKNRVLKLSISSNYFT